MYVAPVLCILVLVLFLPAGFAVYYSLLDLESVRPVGFAGLENYRRVLSDPEIIATLARTAVFTTGNVLLTLSIALVCASYLNKLTQGRATLIQIVIVLPWILSTVVGALLFRWLFLTDISPGLYILRLAGIELAPLTQPNLAMVSLVLVAVWRTLGFAVIILLAGMKAVPHEYYEAARVDGASRTQRFHLITLPLIKTPMVITTVVLTMTNLNNVETPLVTTQGGPGTSTQILPLTIYERAFTYFDYSGGAALAVLALCVNTALVFVYLRLARWHV